MEVYAGEKSTTMYGADVWLSAETLATLKEYSVSVSYTHLDVYKRQPLSFAERGLL